MPFSNMETWSSYSPGSLGFFRGMAPEEVGNLQWCGWFEREERAAGSPVPEWVGELALSVASCVSDCGFSRASKTAYSLCFVGI